MKNPEKNKTTTSLNNTPAKDLKSIKRTRRKRKRDILKNTTKKSMTSKTMISADYALISKKKPLRTQMKNQKSIQVLSLKMNNKKVFVILLRAMEINV